jgi:hypothetical protein
MSPISHKRSREDGLEMGDMPNKPFFTSSTKTKPRRTGEAVDVAARYFVYELYDTTSGHAGEWKALRNNAEVQATVTRAIERGWVMLQGKDGKYPARSAALTDEGRRLARRGR